MSGSVQNRYGSIVRPSWMILDHCQNHNQSNKCVVVASRTCWPSFPHSIAIGFGIIVATVGGYPSRFGRGVADSSVQRCCRCGPCVLRASTPASGATGAHSTTPLLLYWSGLDAPLMCLCPPPPRPLRRRSVRRGLRRPAGAPP